MLVMDDAKLKLGAKRLLRKAISVVHLRSFFYGGVETRIRALQSVTRKSLSNRQIMALTSVARQHLILQNLRRWVAPYSVAPHSILCLKLKQLSCPSTPLLQQG